jgi:hypothetical protein
VARSRPRAIKGSPCRAFESLLRLLAFSFASCTGSGGVCAARIGVVPSIASAHRRECRVADFGFHSTDPRRVRRATYVRGCVVTILVFAAGGAQAPSASDGHAADLGAAPEPIAAAAGVAAVVSVLGLAVCAFGSGAIAIGALPFVPALATCAFVAAIRIRGDLTGSADLRLASPLGTRPLSTRAAAGVAAVVGCCSLTALLGKTGHVRARPLSTRAEAGVAAVVGCCSLTALLGKTGHLGARPASIRAGAGVATVCGGFAFTISAALAARLRFLGPVIRRTGTAACEEEQGRS